MASFQGSNKPKSIWFDKANSRVVPKPSVADLKHRRNEFIHFDSLSEYEFFQRINHSPWVKNIECHPQVEIYPASYDHPAINWVIDFRVELILPNEPIRLVEYKGGYIRESAFNREALGLRWELLRRNMPKQTTFSLVSPGMPLTVKRGLVTQTPAQFLASIEG